MSNDQNEQKVKSDVSRRGFLKTGGLAMGTMVLGGLVAGCGDDITKIYRSSDSNSNLPKTWDGEADFVMIGFGGAAAAAAITNKEKGLNASMLILEAQDEDKKEAGLRLSAPSTYKCGGGTWLGAGTKIQTDAAFTESKDEFYEATLATVGQGADKDIIRAYADNAVDTFKMLTDAGVVYGPFEDIYQNSPSTGFGLIYDNEKRLLREGKLAKAGNKAVPHAHFATSITNSKGGVSGRGAGLWLPLEKKVFDTLSANDKVIYNTRVTRLITNAAGRVVGVAAVKTKVGEADPTTGVPVIASETELFYKAKKAVLLCNGGFINSKELVEKNVPKAALCNGGKVPSYAGNSMDIGTGLMMGQAVGADTRQLANAEDYWPVYGGVGDFVKAIAVTSYGERFAPEDNGGPEMGKWLVLNYPTTPHVWVIFDSQISTNAKMTAYGAFAATTITAATIDELATKIAAPALAATIARFNGFVDAGKDAQFDKDPATLKKIETGPFYAIKRSIANVFAQTTGGLRTNPKAQVLKADGSGVIPGLYAAGAVTAHIHAQYYAAGGSTGGALVFGRIAVQEMAKETAWDSTKA